VRIRCTHEKFVLLLTPLITCIKTIQPFDGIYIIVRLRSSKYSIKTKDDSTLELNCTFEINIILYWLDWSNGGSAQCAKNLS
jgi:hypothetical protein